MEVDGFEKKTKAYLNTRDSLDNCGFTMGDVSNST